MIDLIIPLPPVPWQAAIKGRWGFYDPKEKEKRCVRYYIKQCYKGDLITDYVRLYFEFFFKVPKSASNKKKMEMLQNKIFPTRCDCTNLQKLHEDCLKGIVIEDDRKVIETHSRKFYAEKESIHIKISKFTDY